MSTATLSSKSQIVVPAEVREHLGLKPGDQIVLEVEDGRAVLRKVHGSVLDELLAAVDPEIFKGYATKLEADRDDWDRDDRANNT